MKASELRLGNLITSDGEIFTVDEIRNDFVSAGALGIYPAGFDCDLGIPLTEEWLLKFGFEDDEPHNKIALDEHGVMTLCFNQYSKMISLFSTGAHYYMPEIQYIHQIQNLYFALTGNDLEIKEGKDNVNDGQTGQMVEDRPGS